MDAWDSDENIMVGKRRARPKRRMVERRRGPRIAGAIVVLVLIGLGVGGYMWLTRPTGLAALPDPAVVGPGGFRSSIDSRNTITVGLQISNATKERLTVVGARITPPVGLKEVRLTILPSGADNQGFTLTGELPGMDTITLDPAQTAVIAARYSINCPALLASGAPTDEAIYVTFRYAGQQREDELDTPVVSNGDSSVPWLTATARQACAGKTPAGVSPAG